MYEHIEKCHISTLVKYLHTIGFKEEYPSKKMCISELKRRGIHQIESNQRETKRANVRKEPKQSPAAVAVAVTTAGRSTDRATTNSREIHDSFATENSTTFSNPIFNKTLSAYVQNDACFSYLLTNVLKVENKLVVGDVDITNVISIIKSKYDSLQTDLATLLTYSNKIEAELTDVCNMNLPTYNTIKQIKYDDIQHDIQELNTSTISNTGYFCNILDTTVMFQVECNVVFDTVGFYNILIPLPKGYNTGVSYIPKYPCKSTLRYTINSKIGFVETTAYIDETNHAHVSFFIIDILVTVPLFLSINLKYLSDIEYSLQDKIYKLNPARLSDLYTYSKHSDGPTEPSIKYCWTDVDSQIDLFAHLSYDTFNKQSNFIYITLPVKARRNRPVDYVGTGVLQYELLIQNTVYTRFDSNVIVTIHSSSEDTIKISFNLKNNIYLNFQVFIQISFLQRIENLIDNLSFTELFYKENDYVCLEFSTIRAINPLYLSNIDLYDSDEIKLDFSDSSLSGNHCIWSKKWKVPADFTSTSASSHVSATINLFDEQYVTKYSCGIDTQVISSDITISPCTVENTVNVQLDNFTDDLPNILNSVKITIHPNVNSYVYRSDQTSIIQEYTGLKHQNGIIYFTSNAVYNSTLYDIEFKYTDEAGHSQIKSKSFQTLRKIIPSIYDVEVYETSGGVRCKLNVFTHDDHTTTPHSVNWTIYMSTVDFGVGSVSDLSSNVNISGETFGIDVEFGTFSTFPTNRLYFYIHAINKNDINPIKANIFTKFGSITLHEVDVLEIDFRSFGGSTVLFQDDIIYISDVSPTGFIIIPTTATVDMIANIALNEQGGSNIYYLDYTQNLDDSIVHATLPLSTDLVLNKQYELNVYVNNRVFTSRKIYINHHEQIFNSFFVFELTNPSYNQYTGDISYANRDYDKMMYIILLHDDATGTNEIGRMYKDEYFKRTDLSGLLSQINYADLSNLHVTFRNLHGIDVHTIQVPEFELYDIPTLQLTSTQSDNKLTCVVTIINVSDDGFFTINLGNIKWSTSISIDNVIHVESDQTSDTMMSYTFELDFGEYLTNVVTVNVNVKIQNTNFDISHTTDITLQNIKINTLSLNPPFLNIDSSVSITFETYAEIQTNVIIEFRDDDNNNIATRTENSLTYTPTEEGNFAYTFSYPNIFRNPQNLQLSLMSQDGYMHVVVLFDSLMRTTPLRANIYKDMVISEITTTLVLTEQFRYGLVITDIHDTSELMPYTIKVCYLHDSLNPIYTSPGSYDPLYLPWNVHTLTEYTNEILVLYLKDMVNLTETVFYHPDTFNGQIYDTDQISVVAHYNYINDKYIVNIIGAHITYKYFDTDELFTVTFKAINKDTQISTQYTNTYYAGTMNDVELEITPNTVHVISVKIETSDVLHTDTYNLGEVYVPLYNHVVYKQENFLNTYNLNLLDTVYDKYDDIIGDLRINEAYILDNSVTRLVYSLEFTNILPKLDDGVYEKVHDNLYFYEISGPLYGTTSFSTLKGIILDVSNYSIKYTIHHLQINGESQTNFNLYMDVIQFTLPS